jgi:hypothetical protein
MLQNFSAIRAVYTEKLKKLRESSKTGAANPVSAPTTPGTASRVRAARKLTDVTQMPKQLIEKQVSMLVFSSFSD